jgi:heterodisulfide reductase subunit C
VSLLNKCDNCQACKDDCPVCKVDPTFQPTEIIGDLVRGNLDGVLEDGQLWKCLECYTCQEMCHSRIGMADTFRKLKELAMAAGTGPESVSAAYQTFLKTGVLGSPSCAHRVRSARATARSRRSRSTAAAGSSASVTSPARS